MKKFNILNFKKKLNIFIIFLQLIRSRLEIGFESSSELIAFFAIVNPIFNKIFYIWFKSLKKENILSLKIAKKLIEDGKKVIIKDNEDMIEEVKKEYGNLFSYEIKH